jgi:hypothetical protein
MDENRLRIPPYLDAGRPAEETTPPLTVPTAGPAVVIIWPDAPSDAALQRIARAIEWALRQAWPPVPTDSPTAH